MFYNHGASYPNHRVPSFKSAVKCEYTGIALYGLLYIPMFLDMFRLHHTV